MTNCDFGNIHGAYFLMFNLRKAKKIKPLITQLV